MSKPATSKKPKAVILVIEDDRALREGLALNLRLHGYAPCVAEDGEVGMRMAFDSKPDLIVLDIMMPCWTGLDILEELRKRGESVPVLILSARSTTPDKVEGLTMGADDYMTKPFDLPELIARIEVMLRRRRSEKDSLPPLIFGNVTIDRIGRVVNVNNKPIQLSAREFDLLCLLAATPGTVYSRDTILERVWGWDYEGTARTVDNFIANLRKKLQPNPKDPQYIQTIPRIGYRLEVPK
jgi:two-component system alkaline phosphatase synthesis response regulator PhoP